MRKQEYVPIMTGLFHLALPHMKGYQSDLGHDVIALSYAEPGDIYLWGWRETGTQLHKCMSLSQVRTAIDVIKMGCNPPQTWHVLRITNRRDKYADGYIEPIGADTNEEVIRKLQDIIDAEVSGHANDA